MQNQFSRTQLLLGKPAIDTLAGARVAPIGARVVGGSGAGVGSARPRASACANHAAKSI